jgi:2'-5' RNA ligase
MKRRLFIAVDIPENVREKIGDVVEEIKHKFGEKARFVPKDNWHITLIFLGYQNEEAIPAIRKTFNEFAENRKGSFSEAKMVINRLTYGPSEGSVKRMIWLTADRNSSAILSKITREISDGLLTNGVRWRIDNRPLNYAHLTLARFRPRNIRDLPPIAKEVTWEFPLTGIDLMESRLRREGPIYERIASVAIK